MTFNGKFIDSVGGRKNVLGYQFIACSTFIVWSAQTSSGVVDYSGLMMVIGAIAAGVGGLVWGNVREHQVKNGHTEAPKP
jgi:hypothetical protein